MNSINKLTLPMKQCACGCGQPVTTYPDNSACSDSDGGTKVFFVNSSHRERWLCYRHTKVD